MARPILYDYFRSSAAYRARIALNLKGVEYESRPVSLASGEQKKAGYRMKNPQGLIPMLEIDGHRIGQSLAICDYLDANYPDPPFVPKDAADRAHVLGLALTVACDIHPLNNLRVLKYLTGELGQPEAAKDEWYRHWIAEGLAALELLARPRAGAFLFGDAVSLADICLVPQLYNARRFSISIDPYPTLRRADETASAHPAFAAAHPERQDVPA
ncbi:maleylacetoacetate isomerase [Sphingomonas sp. ASV193]|uniref:maleylacetoacetate isomerase n=1 Tax=Sphingomonas sp. ASV193 TaxID=3144405 RepID=UPI0032E85E8E